MPWCLLSCAVCFVDVLSSCPGSWISSLLISCSALVRGMTAYGFSLRLLGHAMGTDFNETELGVIFNSCFTEPLKPSEMLRPLGFWRHSQVPWEPGTSPGRLFQPGLPPHWPLSRRTVPWASYPRGTLHCPSWTLQILFRQPVNRFFDRHNSSAVSFEVQQNQTSGVQSHPTALWKTWQQQDNTHENYDKNQGCHIQLFTRKNFKKCIWKGL